MALKRAIWTKLNLKTESIMTTIQFKVNNRTVITVTKSDAYDEFTVLVRNNGRLSIRGGGCYTMASLTEKYPSLENNFKSAFKTMYAIK